MIGRGYGAFEMKLFFECIRTRFASHLATSPRFTLELVNLIFGKEFEDAPRIFESRAVEYLF
jgi:hypothetical protein